MQIIHTREQLRELARDLGVRSNWHEPDEQGLTARLDGMSFDNAGFWPTAEALRSGHLTVRSVEQHIVITRADPDDGCNECGQGEGTDVAAINLATLLSWAAEPQD
jgi:hypothetical protein